MPAIRNQEYAAVVDRERPLIEATAYLLTGDQVQAERAVQLVCAELYWRLPGAQDPQVEALRAVVQTAHGPVRLPWEPRRGFELIDGLPVAEPIIADLRMLPYDQRVAVILASYAGLPPVQIAKILKRPVGDVLLLARQARAALAAGHPARMSDEAITQELKDAIPHVMRESHDSADDLAHGGSATVAGSSEARRLWSRWYWLSLPSACSSPRVHRFRRRHQRVRIHTV